MTRALTQDGVRSFVECGDKGRRNLSHELHTCAPVISPLCLYQSPGLGLTQAAIAVERSYPQFPQFQQKEKSSKKEKGDDDCCYIVNITFNLLAPNVQGALHEDKIILSLEKIRGQELGFMRKLRRGEYLAAKKTFGANTQSPHFLKGMWLGALGIMVIDLINPVDDIGMGAKRADDVLPRLGKKGNLGSPNFSSWNKDYYALDELRATLALASDGQDIARMTQFQVNVRKLGAQGVPIADGTL